PLPPLPEQKRIAAILDAADALRAKRRESLEQLDQLLQSTFLEMFGDPVRYAARYPMKALGVLAVKITDGEHGTVARLESGKLYLMARNITRDLQLDLSDISYISEDDHERIFKRCGPEAGDLLLVCVGATIGKVAMVPDMEPFSLARSVALIKPDRRHLEPTFLLHLFNSDFIQFRLVGKQNVAAQAGLYLSQIRSIQVPCPSLDEQCEYAGIVESIEQQKARYRTQLDELDTLFASLQSRAFNGEL
ncbi:MAG: restriction endonuclease subunit S, partial [Steroidobacteraceae bacterium]